MIRVGLFLCFLAYCGNLLAQTVQETNSTNYSPWSVNAFSLATVEADQLSNGGLLNTYNYIGPNYRLNSNERLSLKMAFIANTTGHDQFNGDCVQSQNASFDNPFLEYTNYNLGLLPGLVDIFWYGRVYAPMSSSYRSKNTIARYRSNVIFTRWITQKFFMEYRNDISFFHQSKTTYIGTHTEECQVVDNTGPSNTQQYQMDNWLNFWYRVNYRFSLGISYLFRQEGYNKSNSIETSRQRNARMTEITAYFGPSIRYVLNDNYNFILSFRDSVEYSGFHPDRQDSLSDLGKFKSKNTEISLLSFIRF